MVVSIILFTFVSTNNQNNKIMVATQNLQDIANTISKAYGDRGSCVMGYELKLDGNPVVFQPAQGSSTCAYVYKILTAIMIADGINASCITTDYGVMD